MCEISNQRLDGTPTEGRKVILRFGTGQVLYPLLLSALGHLSIGVRLGESQQRRCNHCNEHDKHIHNTASHLACTCIQKTIPEFILQQSS